MLLQGQLRLDDNNVLNEIRKHCENGGASIVVTEEMGESTISSCSEMKDGL